MSPRTISIHYRRLPDREVVFHQRLVHESPDCTVTFLDAAQLAKPVMARGTVILEPGAPVVWFTYPGRWYDVGRFHLCDGTFTGFYANVLTPVVMQRDEWWTTDLCLDFWLGADGDTEILDEEEFAHAEQSGWITPEQSVAARITIEELARAARNLEFPGDREQRWDLTSVRTATY